MTAAIAFRDEEYFSFAHEFENAVASYNVDKCIFNEDVSNYILVGGDGMAEAFFRYSC